MPSENEYKIQLLSKVESFTKRMRWKALEFLGKLESAEKETFGFKSNKCPAPVEQLTAFETDIILMINNIEFKPVRCEFQHKLKTDIKSIKQCEKLLIPADKSTNIYKIEQLDYNKHLLENNLVLFSATFICL